MPDVNDQLGEYKDLGFSLKQPDAEILILSFKGHQIARYFGMKVSSAIIQKGCKNYLANVVRNI